MLAAVDLLLVLINKNMRTIWLNRLRQMAGLPFNLFVIRERFQVNKTGIFNLAKQQRDDNYLLTCSWGEVNLPVVTSRTILNSIFRGICLHACCTIYFYFQYEYMTLHLTWSRNFSSKNCTKRVVTSLTLKCVMEIILRCLNEETYAWLVKTPVAIF